MNLMRKSKSGRILSGALMALLLCALVVTGTTFAAYRATGSAGDSARVAKFNVTHSVSSMADISLDVSGTANDSRWITITNNSEVAITYKVKIVASAPLPQGTVISLSGSSASVTADGSDKEFILSDASIFKLGPREANDRKLTIDVTNVTEDFTGSIDISVIAEQKI